MKKILSILVLSILVISCAQSPADLVILSGKVVTVDQDFSIHEAIAIKDGSFVYVGDNDQARKYIGQETEVMTLNGEMVLPGLIDSHAHLHSLGDKLGNLDISGSSSFEKIVEKVAAKVSTVEAGEWIIGGRWDHTLWANKSFPIHDQLSAVSANNPVYLSRVDGNSAFVNAKALELAGIRADSPDPVGGKIIRKENGDPTGVLINRAMNLVKDLFPIADEEVKKRRFLEAVAHCNQYGLTGIHEAGVGPKEIALYKSLIDNEELNIRMYAMLGEQEVPVLEGDLESYFRNNRIENYANYMLEVKSIKLFFDGALGSRGAAFL